MQDTEGRKEIAQYFDLLVHNARINIDNLVLDGKLKMTIPLSPSAKQQKYTTVDTEVVILSAAALIEHCRAERTKDEIVEHFGFSTKIAFSHHLYPLIDEGKISRTRSIGSKQQKYINTAKTNI